MYAMLLTAVLGAGTADAATYSQKLDLDALSSRATTIVIGEVISTYPVKKMGVIYTVAEIEVGQTLKGSPERIVTVTVPGGRLRGEETIVPGSPRFVKDYEMLLYMDGEQIVGLGQGSFVVEYGVAWRANSDDVFISPTKQHDWAEEIDPNSHYTAYPLAEVRRAAR
jgi:hypothetical protein